MFFTSHHCSFLNGWMDNKIRVLLFGKIEVIRLRYLASAYKYRSRAALGYVNLNDEKTAEVAARFGVPAASDDDTCLLFNENQEGGPVARLSMKDIPVSTLNEMIEANQFLQLPRLSSQVIELCVQGC